jgi:hypothetical protein
MMANAELSMCFVGMLGWSDRLTAVGTTEVDTVHLSLQQAEGNLTNAPWEEKSREVEAWAGLIFEPLRAAASCEPPSLNATSQKGMISKVDAVTTAQQDETRNVDEGGAPVHQSRLVRAWQ